jgi:hypothetical protein
LTGGDPLTLDTRHLESVLSKIREIPHVNIIRIGSKMLAYNPYRILNDPELLHVLSRYSTPEKRIYLMAHFNHPRELTDVSREAAELLRKAGVMVVSQTPILKDVNDAPETLTTLFRQLSFAGISPYYVFQCRPATGNQFFQVPVEQSYEALQKSWHACSGLAKRARFVMSHATGKIEIVGKTAEHVFMRYHQSADPANIGKFMVYKSNPLARWFDDYRHSVTDNRIRHSATSRADPPARGSGRDYQAPGRTGKKYRKRPGIYPERTLPECRVPGRSGYDAKYERDGECPGVLEGLALAGPACCPGY